MPVNLLESQGSNQDHLNDRLYLISATGLHKSYSNPIQNRINVLNGISITIYPQRVIAIVGPSGSGKSTLLRLLAGIEQPDTGIVDYKYASRNQLSAIPMVLQSSALLPWRTVRENIALSLELLGKSANASDLDRYVHLMGLNGFAESLPRDLSGGMRARVSIGRALVAASDLVMFDEAFTDLDEVTRQTLNDIFCQHVEHNGLAAVVVSHDIAEAVYLADEVIVLTKRPSEIAATFQIELPRPRNPQLRTTLKFTNVVNPLREFVVSIWK